MPIKIAIIEDEPSILQLYQFKFEAAGYEVGTAIDGKAGLELLEKTCPDLVLLDLRMPTMDGAEMLEKLRATVWGSEIRVIILTNISRDEAPASLRFLSVDRYIVKAHHTPAQILQIVEEVLGAQPSRS